MAAPTSNIKGRFTDSQGTVRAGASVTFEPQGTPLALGGDIVTGSRFSVTLSPAGKFGDVTDTVPFNVVYPLVKGVYRVIVANDDAFFINVPGDGALWDIKDIAVDLGTGEVLNNKLMASDLLSLIDQTYGLKASLKGDSYQAKSRLCVFGEGRPQTTDNFRLQLYNSLNESTDDGNGFKMEVLSLGNANPGGLSGTIDANIGQIFYSKITNYAGAYGSENIADGRFYYALGSEDWIPGNVTAVTNFFTFPNNERYYKVAGILGGNADLFVISSSASEPDGNTQGSTQGVWLQTQLAASTARFKIVAFRDTPKCSKTGYSFPNMDWPFASWGANLVLAAGPKFYERITLSGNIPLIVCGIAFSDTGTGGDTFGTPISGSQKRVDSKTGFLVIEANESTLVWKFLVGNLYSDPEDTGTISPTDQSSLHLIPQGKHGFKTTSQGFALDYGGAQTQVLSGPAYYIALTAQRILRTPTTPLVSAVNSNPFLQDCLWLVGDDPAKFYYYNKADRSIQKLLTDASYPASIHSGAITQLASPGIGSQVAPSIFDGYTYTNFVELSHGDNTVELWYSVNGSPFVQLTNWTTNARIWYNGKSPWWVAAYAKKTGYAISEVNYASLMPLW